jgi:hypothetical protein
MPEIKPLLRTLRTRLMYLVALLLILLIPLIFISFGSGIITNLAKKIPLREGNFSSTNGQLRVERTPGQR